MFERVMRLSFLDVLVAACLCSSSLLLAHQDHRECEDRILDGSKEMGVGRQHIISTDPTFLERFSNDYSHLIRVASELGYSIPEHFIQFAPSGDLNKLLSAGGNPVLHWIDGKAVFDNLGKPSSVLEFVHTAGDNGGCSFCRSYFQDNTPERQQRSIGLHVIGHNHVFANSYYYKVRNQADPMGASYKMYFEMLALRNEQGVDIDEINRFYEFLSGLSGLQDLNFGSYDSPDSIKKAQIESERKGRNLSIPSVLQAIVANLPHSSEPWKFKIAELFEQRQSWEGAAVMTKIINEGWATFSQLHILKHLNPQFREQAELLEVSELMDSHFNRVMDEHPDMALISPYWQGTVAGFINIYRDFLTSHNAQGLGADSEEIDRSFVRWATENVIGPLDDAGFINLGMNDKWLSDSHLILVRLLYPWEDDYKRNKGLLKNPGDKMYIALARDAQRLRNHVIRKHTLNTPTIRPHLEFVNGSTDGHFHIRHNHIINEGIPLNIPNALFVLWSASNLLNKPVMLDTIIPRIYLEDDDTFVVKLAIRDYTENGNEEARVAAEEALQGVPARFTVTKDGEVRLYFRAKSPTKGWVEETGPLLNQLQDILTQHQDSYIAAHSDRNSAAAKWDEKAGDILTDSYSSRAHNFAPTAAGAILEYQQFSKHLMALAIQRALDGKDDPNITKTGVKLNALPYIPHIALDSHILKLQRLVYPPAPVYEGEGREPKYDDVAILTSSSRLVPGSIFVQPAKEKQQGEGDGENEEGDEGEGQGEGSGGKDPREVEVDWQQWGDIVFKHLQLKNPRKTYGGLNEEEANVRRGILRIKREPYNYKEMIPTAYAIGAAAQSLEGTSPGEIFATNSGDLVRKGLPFLTFSQHATTGMRKVPQPSSKAVLVFAMDLSGSMSGEPVERAKKFFYNSIEVLKRSFADIEFKLIGFDSKSHLFQSEKKFFRTELGGSTSYAAGIKMAADVLENYPEDEYNRYFYLAGDSGDFDAAGAETELERVLKLTEHVGYVETGTYADARFQAMLDSVAQRVPEKFTYSIYNGKKGSLIKSLEDFFTEGQARQGDDY